ncbi:MAG: hypothetical protein A2600_09860 [Candidatus Lambdaproteobacteria bacterium RIFOXYD1_FULL_56_27]|uniref:TraG P-loop domain-containing protein n=1 Tax=Candidatus Lambdaproteobacteria bacterium RIFOXYD2_FULL_56_26 TaxID=1817773 RepID=A0A1F6GU60_9PROT|nr:MAG: hypothetical protein A2557_11830 [Candidatus Lambdaproteobacteria bacterium RIFOXYD2_FULL_56_26]OGH04322.1 MAG: hypothetical protein A2426_05715 [Candidatus Lambdaproteobacteria bacterium RIFOXYC1_FULL_56_13]OGH07384.1 MAG: hypothetical protein A2600_09860 [Candidatus Lambdaproteobacteria bacterium RIFOXYD1_FULL_56_27]
MSGITARQTLNFLKHWVEGPIPGPTVAALESLTERDRFSQFLPWMSYSPKDEFYFLEDDSLGFLWECVPHCYSSDESAKKLESIFRDVLPENTVVSFILYADPFIEPILDGFKGKKTRDLPIIREAAEELSAYFRKGTQGLGNMQGIPVRHYRLFVSVKIPAMAASKANLDMVNLKVSLNEKLKSAGFQPTIMAPVQLLEFFRRLTDPSWGPQVTHYDPAIPINDQAIKADLVIESGMDGLKIGENHWLCQTVKRTPKNWNVLQMNKILGGMEGITSDSSQITTPYLLCVNLVIRDLRTTLHRRAAILNNQKSFGTFGKTLAAMREEHNWALARYENNEKFVLCMPIFWTWSKDKEELAMIATRVKTLWENEGFVMQRDRGILTTLFLCSLPFGLRTQHKMVEKLQRDFPVPVETAVKLLPTQADFTGIGIPSLLFVGRKGQLSMMDIINKGSTNMNGFVAAGSGGGKSFLINYILFNYFGMGAKIRIIDIGFSYKKMATMLGARYLEFSAEQEICVNPFGTMRSAQADDEAFNIAVDQVSGIFLMMAVPVGEPAQSQKGLINEAVRWAWEQREEEAITDDVMYFLDHLEELYLSKKTSAMVMDLFTEKSNAQNPESELSKPLEKVPEKHVMEAMLNSVRDAVIPETEASYERGTIKKLDQGFKDQLVRIGHGLSMALKDYSTQGPYAKYFCGPATFNIGNDDMVILELEQLKAQPTLFKLITTIVVNAVTLDLYLSDRSQPRLIVFDEAWQFLTPGSLIGKMIEEGYRRARKYNGSFTTVTQSILDLEKFGPVGDVIMANSSYKWFLASVDFNRAREKKLIDYDEFTMRILNTVQTQRGMYSEIFVKTDKSFGVVRLAIDPFSYYVYTSDPEEVSAIEQLVATGLTYPEAIRELIRRRKGP